MLFPVLWPLCAQAAFLPLPLSPESFNYDMVVEHSAPAPVVSVTTASMDTGWANTGYSWYQRGYNADWPATGLPAPGAVITSDLAANHFFRFAPEYRTNNVLLVDTNIGTAELRFVTPASYTRLSFLLSGMHNGSRGTLGLTVHHEDGSAETGLVTSPGWLDSGYAAYAAQGRVNVATFTFEQVNGGVPKLFTADFTVTNVTSPVSRVVFAHLSGERTAIFALSGAVQPGADFEPIPVSGYSADIIVEASATRPQWLGGVTTASMETGTANTLRTWFEQGYVPSAPWSGLPAAGATFTNAGAPTCQFIMPSSYGAKNVRLLDGTAPAGSLSLLTPTALHALSFLTASANGPTTNQCIAHHADGASETNLFISPDWTSQSAAAWSAGGRVTLNNRIIDYSGGDGPSLFSADVPLLNTGSPVTNITVVLLNPPPGAHTVVFAVSGQLEPVPVRAPILTIRETGPGTLLIESTEPGILESAAELSGASSTWTDEGPVDHSRTVQSSPNSRFWRVRQQR